MRSIGVQLAVASMVFAAACSGDRALAPKSGHTGQISDLPPEEIAAYTRTTLPGSDSVVALNDSGDVVGATATGGVLWHGAAHERTILPIIPTAIANDGTVAGSIDGHAATWKSGRVTILDTAASVALAICRCASSTVVGSVQVNGETHAAIWVDGIRIDAGVPPRSKHAEFASIATGFVVANAMVREPDPHTGDSTNLPEPYSWSPARGWESFTYDNSATTAIFTSLNSHGTGVGIAVGPNSFNIIRATVFDLTTLVGDDSPPSHQPFDSIFPTGINDSGAISANADFSPEGEFEGQVGLVNGRVLPPGVFGDRTAGINSAGIVAGNSNGSAVLWIPNP